MLTKFSLSASCWITSWRIISTPSLVSFSSPGLFFWRAPKQMGESLIIGKVHKTHYCNPLSHLWGYHNYVVTRNKEPISQTILYMWDVATWEDDEKRLTRSPPRTLPTWRFRGSLGFPNDSNEKEKEKYLNTSESYIGNLLKGPNIRRMNATRQGRWGEINVEYPKLKEWYSVRLMLRRVRVLWPILRSKTRTKRDIFGVTRRVNEGLRGSWWLTDDIWGYFLFFS